MSYSSMAKDEVRCDFPDCDNDFDDSNGAKVAMIDKSGEIIAFCKEHCKRLISEGIGLRVLAEIHKKITDRENAVERKRENREQTARESAFIKKLKK